jgi:hypothetical protein
MLSCATNAARSYFPSLTKTLGFDNTKTLLMSAPPWVVRCSSQLHLRSNTLRVSSDPLAVRLHRCSCQHMALGPKQRAVLPHGLAPRSGYHRLHHGHRHRAHQRRRALHLIVLHDELVRRLYPCEFIHVFVAPRLADESRPSHGWRPASPGLPQNAPL